MGKKKDKETTPSPIRERMETLCEELGLSLAEFSLSIGHNRAFLATVGKDIKADTLARILKTYPEVSWPWLIMGEGQMFEDSSVSRELVAYLKKQNAELQATNRELTQELGALKYELSLLRKSATLQPTAVSTEPSDSTTSQK